MKKQCKTFQKLIPSFLTNEIDNSDKIAFENHIKICPDCQSKIKEFQKTLNILEFAKKKSNFPQYSTQKILASLQEKPQHNYKFVGIAGFALSVLLVLFFVLSPFSSNKTSSLTLTQAYPILVDFSYQNSDKVWLSYLKNTEEAQYTVYESLYVFLKQNLEEVDNNTVDQYYAVLAKNINYFL